MVIHHDKLAYGKLEGLGEELSEEKLLEMLAQINAQTELEEAKRPPDGQGGERMESIRQKKR